MRILENLRRFADEGRIALVDGSHTLSFSHLNIRSDAIALWLSENIPAHKPIVLWGDKEHDMTCCIFGALKSSHPYVVIPSHYPATRIDVILDDCKAPLIFNISQTDIPGSHPPKYYSGDIDKWVALYQGCRAPDELSAKPEDICCIFYTSGSTGKPKGVQISRSNIETMLDWWGSIVTPWLPENGGRALNFSSYAFSTSMDNLFYILADRGLTLYAVSRSLAMDYQKLFDYIVQVDPHFQTGTPSFASVCLQDTRFCRDYLPSLRFLVLGGEVLPHTVGRQILQRFPDVFLCNGYGATETTIGTIACRVTDDMLADTARPIPIGRTSQESHAWVVNEQGDELPDGQTGELVIVSGMISQGYLNNPERTKQVFFTTTDGRRGFCTGDLVYRRQSLFYYMGRKDNLVKVGGYRVELEDIEKNIRRIPMIHECAVVPVTRENQVIMLAAYVAFQEPVADKLESIIALKKNMAEIMPAYMIPQKIVILNELPKNNSGKIDRASLKDRSRLNWLSP
ncbi:MAG: AMP-binding protein [Clostridiaceae bacterium]|nr:AMP-binding protein [Clostridiaceae bacterium]